MSGEARFVIDLVVRADALTKGGGDFFQAEKYAESMRAAGDDVRIVEYASDFAPRESALVHYFNLDRPFDFLEVAKAATGHPFYVSTIHHDATRVRLMRRGQASGARGTLVTRIPETLRSLLVYLSRLRSEPRSHWRTVLAATKRSLLAAGRIKREIRDALASADAVFVLSERERLSLESDFGWTGTVVETPNGAPPQSTLAERRHERAGIICVGRIESRKRVLDLAKAASEMAVPVLFIGTPNLNEPHYVGEFALLAERSEFVEWTRGLDHAAVLALMKRTRVLVNCSWVEVQSLVDIEAASSGCWVVTTANGGSSADWIPSHVIEASVDDVREVLRLAKSRAEPGEEPGDFRYPHTWESTTARIRAAYKLANTKGSHGG